MLTLWIVVIVLGVLQLFEIGLLLFLLQGLGKMKQAGALFSTKQESSPFADRGRKAHDPSTPLEIEYKLYQGCVPPGCTLSSPYYECNSSCACYY